MSDLTLKARILELEHERDQLLESLAQVVTKPDQRSEQETVDQCRAGRVARAGNHLILNLQALNNDTGAFFAEFEHYHSNTQTAVLRLLKQHHDLLVNQFKQFNFHL